MAERHIEDRSAGQNDMFGAAGGDQSGSEGVFPAEAWVEAPPWSDEERLGGEKETLGLYLTGHPVNRYLPELQRFTTCRLADLKPSRDQTVTVAGLVTGMRTMNSRRGDRIAFVTLDDRSGRLEVGVFAEAYNHFRDLLVKDRLLVVVGSVSVDDYSGGFRMSAEHIYDIDQAREVYARRLELVLDDVKKNSHLYDTLAGTLRPFRDGRCPVWLNYRSDDARASLALGREWCVRPSDELIRRLEKMDGLSGVDVVY